MSRHGRTRWGVAITLVGVTLCSAAAAGEPAPPIRVYSRLMDPREHPDYDRRCVKPPSWDTFGNLTQFTALRGFTVDKDVITGYTEELDRYTKDFELGKVIWPAYPVVFARNLEDLAREIQDRGLYLFDIWGYVPGSGPGGYWTQFHPDPEVFAMLEATLGDRWLGMDNGEQDGRYIGGYASQMSGISTNRFDAYLNFQRHFERMGDELGNKLSTLVSLNFGHYFLKEGVYATIGAETAQALPNSQVYYAFIRGAGKQHGVPWFGNASVFNRWGYKAYGSSGPDHGPLKGSSLNLLKRLLYSHILYNCVFVGFESGWFDGESLSPIGHIQQAAQRWVNENGQPGVMHTPVALLLDFYSGWTFPRHLYTEHVYRVWGGIPYALEDHLTNGILGLLYPGYQDASYFHDETGFLTATPYGDIADCLLSDAPGWLLARYPLVIVAGGLRAGPEIADKLAAYVNNGGHLVVTLASWRKLADAFPGLPAAPGEGDASATWATGAGQVTLIGSEFGVVEQAATSGPVENATDRPLANPHPLDVSTRTTLDALLQQQVLFEAGEGLGLITCRKGPGEYTLGVFNNGLVPRPWRIVSRCGPIEALTELPLDQSEKGAPGFLPEGFENAAVGAGSGSEIAGGDVRIFSVRVREENVAETPHAAPPPRPRGRFLALPVDRLLKEEILARPTFFEHFDGVMIDWRYLIDRTPEALRREAGWLGRQGLRIAVDLSSGINLYPDLRLVNNDPVEYETSMRVIGEVLQKMPLLGARDLILCLHRVPENNITAEAAHQSFDSTLRELSALAAHENVTVHLRMAMKAVATVAEAAQILERVGAPNLRVAASAALISSQGNTPDYVRTLLDGKIGLWLASAPGLDLNGQLWTVHAPIAGAHQEDTLRGLFTVSPETPIVCDAIYETWDAEYRDIKTVESVTKK